MIAMSSEGVVAYGFNSNAMFKGVPLKMGSWRWAFGSEGEAIIRGTLAMDVAAVMEYKGLKLQEAVDWVVKIGWMRGRQG
ncbi:hypothetical protein Sjap_002768 [Stephania japonica]|uniref:Uncharacterized protein n=1 Tax=Stephania japonica TaxID=461633 RepID=A0AAP0PSV4_9MAGN